MIPGLSSSASYVLVRFVSNARCHIRLSFADYLRNNFTSFYFGNSTKIKTQKHERKTSGFRRNPDSHSFPINYGKHVFEKKAGPRDRPRQPIIAHVDENHV